MDSQKEYNKIKEKEITSKRGMNYENGINKN